MRLLPLLALLPAILSAQSSADVWAVPAIYKVRPNERPQAKNLVWDKSARRVSIAGAKREHVPFQLVITVPPRAGRGTAPASGFFVEASELVSAGGRIPRDRVKLYFEHDVLCYGKSSPVGDTGFWPDALVPLTDPFSMAAEFRSAIESRGVWVDIETPPDIPAGDYSGKLKVTRNGQPLDEISIALKVYNFALPEETHLITYMGVSSGDLAKFHGVEPGSAREKALLVKYHAFLYANRMEPWFNESLQPAMNISGGKVGLRFDDQAYDLYLNRWKTKRVILEAVPGQLASDPALVRSYLGQVADFYRKHGWLNRLVFNSPIDEPSTAQAYADTRKWAAMVHEAAPGVPFLVTEQPVPENPAWGTLSGFANNYSIHGNELNKSAVRQAIPREQAKGGEITWYISCDQRYPQPNYFVDGPAMDPVMVPWITWRYGMQGILYWELKYWPQTPDPWLSPVTYLSGFLCSRGYVLNGEGSLLYPGSRAHRYTGQRDVDGPVSSIRFELLREGIEDYEYLWMLKSLGGQRFADEMAKEMVVDVGAFSRNVEELFAAREKMARRIEQLSR